VSTSSDRLELGSTKLEEAALKEIALARAESHEPQLEASLSIHEWVQRVQGATLAAHRHCRAGDVDSEVHAWAEVAAIAQSRIETVIFLAQDKEASA
jgi:hypothetical protein